MRISYLPKFGREFRKLPAIVKGAAIEKESIFRKDPFDPRLKTHKLHGHLEGFWSFSVTHRYRCIFDFKDDGTVRFYSIGDHDIYT